MGFSPAMPRVFKNTNTQSVLEKEKDKKEKLRNESEQKKQQIKEAKEKQKQKADERKEKEKKRTQKGERRTRWQLSPFCVGKLLTIFD